MTDHRFKEIETLIEDAGRVFAPDTGLMEDILGLDDDDGCDLDLDPAAFLSSLGISSEECAEYVQRKTQEYEDEFRDA
jgi:hypothetical protein